MRDVRQANVVHYCCCCCSAGPQWQAETDEPNPGGPQVNAIVQEETRGRESCERRESKGFHKVADGEKVRLIS